MINFNKLLKDQIIPVILLFSILISLILASKVSNLIDPSRKVLGAFDPPLETCEKNACGYCRNCGPDRLTCGQLSRCTAENGNYNCRFDINCFQ